MEERNKNGFWVCKSPILNTIIDVDGIIDRKCGGVNDQLEAWSYSFRSSFNRSNLSYLGVLHVGICIMVHIGRYKSHAKNNMNASTRSMGRLVKQK